MVSRVKRYFLEIKNFSNNIDLNLPESHKIILDNKNDFQLNKFFYKQIGLDHFWRDRLLWSDKEWQKYINNKNLDTGVMKLNDELIGFFEQEFHEKKNEIELIQMGILREHQGKKFGSFLLECILNKAFNKNVEKVWVHTCSLDHKHALNNYLSKGFAIFKEETIDFTF